MYGDIYDTEMCPRILENFEYASYRSQRTDVSNLLSLQFITFLLKYLTRKVLPQIHTTKMCCLYIISPNEVFGDIMVLASPSCPPLDPDDVNNLTRTNIQSISFKLYMWVDSSLSYFTIVIMYSMDSRTNAFVA